MATHTQTTLDNEPLHTVFVTGAHASQKVQDGTQFTVNMGNSIGVEKASGINVKKVIIPHVFPNVNSFRDTWTFSAQVVQLLVAQYTIAELVAALTAALTNVTVTFSTVTQRVTILNSTGADLNIFLSAEQWDMLGYNWRDTVSFTKVGEIYDITFATATSIVASYPPNLAGEQLIHVVCDRLASSHMINGDEGVPYDVMVTVPLAETEYLSSKSFVPPHALHSRINFNHSNPINSTLTFSLLDTRMRKLNFPLNHHMELVFLCHHKEFTE